MIMNFESKDDFGSRFERIVISLLLFMTGAAVLYLSAEGPLILKNIRYRTSLSGAYQVMGQDLANICLMFPVLSVASITLLMKKNVSKYMIMMVPLYLMYYVLSYTLGIEWSSSVYDGNSEKYAFVFLFILVSSLLVLLYALTIFPKNMRSSFGGWLLRIYSSVFTLLILLFASMWVRQVVDVVQTGAAIGYREAPAGFWTIRMFDLGFTVPFGLLSVYLLWTRPDTTCAIQYMFYGFFITMLAAVNSMAVVMLLKKDNDFMPGTMVLFVALLVVVLSGFVFVHKRYKAV